MPVTINQNKVKFKKPDGPGFIEFDTIAGETTQQLVAELQQRADDIKGTDWPATSQELTTKVNNLVKFQDTAPSTSSTTQVWVDTSSNAAQVAVPTMEEFDDLKNNFNNIIGEGIYTLKTLSSWTSGGYYGTNVAKGTTIDLTTIVPSQNYIGQYTEVSAGDIFILKGTGGSGPRLWGWLDTSKKLLQKAVEYESASDLQLTAENDGYLVVNVSKNTQYYLKKKTYDKTLTETVNAKVDLPHISKNICNPENKTTLYVSNGGLHVSESTANIGYYVEVKPNTDYTVTVSESTYRFGIGACNFLLKDYSATSLSYSTSSTSVTINTGNYKYLLIQVKTSSSGSFPEWIQVEQGTRYTGYEPYNGVMNTDDVYGYKLDGTPVNIASTASKYKKVVNWGNPPHDYYTGQGSNYSQFSSSTLSSEIYTAFDGLVSGNTGYVTRTDLGAGSDSQHLFSYTFQPAQISNPIKPIPKVIIISGQHGFEKGAVFGLTHLMTDICSHWERNSVLDYFRHHVQFIVVPCVNRYGFDNNIYKNYNGVNLNRNYDDDSWELVDDPTVDSYGGAEPFDQPETQYVRDIILANKDAVYFADWHTNGQYAVNEPQNMNWITATDFQKSQYTSHFIDAAAEHLSKMTGHLISEYNLNMGNSLCGYVTYAVSARPTAGRYAWNNGILGHTFETNNGLYGGSTLDADCQRGNSELFGNWLNTLLSKLAKYEN